MTLADQIAADVSTVFMNTDDFACSITYHRGGGSVSLSALVSESAFESTVEFGTTTFETRDYLVQPSLLVISSTQVYPQKGDTIDDGGLTYIVTQPLGAREWRYDDEDRHLMRIHTVLQARS